MTHEDICNFVLNTIWLRYSLLVNKVIERYVLQPTWFLPPRTHE